MTKRTLFVLAAVVLAALGIYYRAESTKQAKAMAAAITSQDTAGVNTVASLQALNDYAKVHMGASVAVTFTGSYTRAQAAATAAANAQNATGQVYADAQRLCSGKSDSIVQARCNQAYISSHLASIPAATPVPTPKLSDYQKTIVAPAWTPDLAGAFFLGSLVAVVMALAGLVRRRR